LILHAITEAYRNIIPPDVFPVALLFIELAPREVDVNVHPSKTEVRFRHAAFIHDFVRDAIRQTLIAARPVAAFPLPSRARGAAAANSSEETEIADRLSEDMPLMKSADMHSETAPAKPVGEDFRLSPLQPPPQTGTLPWTEEVSTPRLPAGGPHGASAHEAAALSIYEAAATAASPDGCGTEICAATSESGEFPADLQPLGQIQDSFIVATNSDGLWIIDQHVAHERVLFEHHLRQRREKRVEVQRLLLPIIVELKPEQQIIFQDMAEELARNGFEVEPFGQRTIAVKAAPADISAEHVQHLLLEILDGVGQEVRTISLDLLLSKIAASIACHAAIKVNMPLDSNKMNWLLRELRKTECPMACPHGRPITLRYGLRELQKAFKRI
jgi:DNA mismatch repair protein MutL